MSFEYHCASIQHLGCMNALAFLRICGPVIVRCRSSETNHQYEYWHKCIHGFLLTANKVFTPSQCNRVYSLVAPYRLPDLTSLALLGSVSGQRGLSRSPLPGYKTVSKWQLQLQDSTPFLLLSQRFCTTLHTSASLGCYLLFTLMPDCPLAPLGQVWQQ